MRGLGLNFKSMEESLDGSHVLNKRHFLLCASGGIGGTPT